MRYKVIFDTNIIRNAESISDFLGGAADLERFSKVSEIIIPDIVIEEIKAQKKRHLVKKRDAFLSNPFHLLRKIDEKETKDFDINRWISELIEKEKVSYSLISLSEKGVLEKMKRLCLDSLPPFEEGSDKGFKDAYIYFTIIEYLESNKEEKIFFVTNDNRLKEAFLLEDQIMVIKDYNEFEKYIDKYFREEYFISRLREEIDPEINDKNIEEIWLNVDENWVLKVRGENVVYFVEVDFSSKEIVDFTDFDFSKGITGIVASRTFGSVHLNIGLINSYLKYFSDEEIQTLIKAFVENDQIHSIKEDQDVKALFRTIYNTKSQIISQDLKDRFESYYKK